MRSIRDISFSKYRISTETDDLNDTLNSLEVNPTFCNLKIYFILLCTQKINLLGRLLRNNLTLGILDLCNNSIGDFGAQTIASALETNFTLTKLYLENNQIGSVGGKALGNALRINTTLIELSLQFNSIKDEGVCSIAEALEVNTMLTVLNIQSNAIGPNGARAIAKVLQTNKSLASLNINDNRIGYVGCRVIAESLQHNDTLICLQSHVSFAMMDLYPIFEKSKILKNQSLFDKLFQCLHRFDVITLPIPTKKRSRDELEANIFKSSDPIIWIK